jgi:hypothetical protein
MGRVVQAKATAAHPQGFAVTEWLEGVAPAAGYLSSAAVRYDTPSYIPAARAPLRALTRRPSYFLPYA